MGAPITAYNRISDTPIRVHSNIYDPDYVVVVDDTLLQGVDVTNGLKENGAILINSNKTPEQLRQYLNGYKGKIYTIDATRISLDCLKANFPNTAMLSAIIKITGIMTKDQLLTDMKESFKHKFARKPDVIEPNMQAIERAYDEVTGGND